MRTAKVLAGVGLLAVAAFAASGCAAQSVDGPVIAPVTMEIGDLQGATVELKVGQVLNIKTGDLDVTSIDGEVADPAVAEFTKGKKDGSAEFNPGVKGLADGETEVVLTHSQGGIQDVTFTVDVDD